MNADYICRLNETLHADKANWEDYWEETLRYVIPRKSNIWTPRDQNSGEKRDQQLYDGTAVDSCVKLAAALNSMLTNPATRWFGLTTGKPELDRRDDVRKFLYESEEELYYVFENSNFYTELSEYYMDQASIGTSPFLILEDENTDVFFHSMPIWDVEVDENNKGVIDTAIRKLRWSAKQIVEEFGSKKLPEVVTEEYSTGGSRKFDLLHAVYPITHEKDEKLVKRLKATGKKFVSKWVIKEGKQILREGGFETNVFVVPRWSKLNGEKFGRGPGMQALPDIKMINAVMKTTIRAAQKITDPPMLVPDDGFYTPPQIVPGGINYYRPGSKDRIETLDLKSRPDFGIQFLDRLEVKIKEAFYINQLILNRDPQMTATEVMQRTEENLRMMGPVLGRQQTEFLAPLIDRTISILARRGRLPMAPDILREQNISAKYSSAIARAQKVSQVDTVQRAMAALAPMAQVDSTVLDNFNFDKAARYIFEMFGLPANIIRDESEKARIRSQRQEQVEAAMRREEEAQQADTFNKVGTSSALINQSTKGNV